MKFCNECKKQKRKISYIGKTGNDKIFSSLCLNCGYDFMYIVNKKLKKVYKTGDLGCKK